MPDTAYAILGILNLVGPSSGYDLRRFIRRSIAFFWDASFAQIYELMRRMETARWVSVRRVEQETRPSKLLYQITDEGKAALKGWLSGPVGRPSYRDPFLLRVFFFNGLDPAERLALVEAESEARAKTLAEYREIAKSVPPIARFPHHTLAFGIAYEEMYLRWLADLKASFEKDGATKGRLLEGGH